MAAEFENLYDLHNHLLFGIDDGARNTANTEAMLKEAAENHIKVIVATPHMLPQTDMVKYENNFPITADLAAKYDIKLLRGAEYNARSFPENPPYITLGGSEHGAILMDFRQPSFPPEFQLCVDNIFNAGYTLIIAHPERTFPETMFRDLERLVESGVSYQVTAGSLLGNFGSAAYKMAWTLLKKGWAKIIASDAHDTIKRPSCLLKAYEAVARKYGFEAAEVLKNNSQLVIESPGTPLQAMPIKKSGINIFNWFRKH